MQEMMKLQMMAGASGMGESDDMGALMGGMAGAMGGGGGGGVGGGGNGRVCVLLV